MNPTYASLIANNALRIFASSYRGYDGSGSKFDAAYQSLIDAFPQVSPAFLMRFAQAAQEAVLAGNYLQQSGMGSVPNPYNIPDFTGSQFGQGYTGNPAWWVDAVMDCEVSQRDGSTYTQYVRVQTWVPEGSTRGDIEEYLIEQIDQDIDNHFFQYKGFNDPQNPPICLLSRFYSISVQVQP